MLTSERYIVLIVFFYKKLYSFVVRIALTKWLICGNLLAYNDDRPLNAQAPEREESPNTPLVKIKEKGNG